MKRPFKTSRSLNYVQPSHLCSELHTTFKTYISTFLGLQVPFDLSDVLQTTEKPELQRVETRRAASQSSKRRRPRPQGLADDMEQIMLKDIKYVDRKGAHENE